MTSYQAKQCEKLDYKKPIIGHQLAWPSPTCQPRPIKPQLRYRLLLHSYYLCVCLTVRVTKTMDMMIHFNDIALANLYNRLYKHLHYDLDDYKVSDVPSIVTVYKIHFLIARTTSTVSVHNEADKITAGLNFRDQFTENYLKQINSLVLTPSCFLLSSSQLLQLLLLVPSLLKCPLASCGM